MFIVLLFIEHNLSISHYILDIFLLLLYLGDYQLKCTWNTKGWRYLIVDVSMSWIFRNRSLVWTIHCFSILNQQLYCNGPYDLHHLSLILHPSNPIKTRINSKKSFKIKLFGLNNKLRSLKSISHHISQRFKSYYRKINRKSDMFHVLPLCWSINWIL